MAKGSDRFAKYGGLYWQVSGLVGDLWIHADAAEVKDGALVFSRKDGMTLFGFAPGTWTTFHAASLIDGSPVAVEHWDDSIPKVGRPRLQISPALRYEIFQRDGRKCRICGRSGDAVTLRVDHIRPQAKGGSNKKSNLQTLCEDCNTGKAGK